MSDWSAIVAGVAKSFADLGWSNVQRSRRSQGSDQLSVIAARASILDIYPIAAGDEMISKERWLQDNRVQLLEVKSLTREAASNPSLPVLDRELVAGQVPDWLDATAQQETVILEALKSLGADVKQIEKPEATIKP